MSLYYYKLKNKKRLEYNSSGFFYCPKLWEAMEQSETNFEVREAHDGSAEIGKWHVEYSTPIKEELPNGDIRIRTERIHKKITKNRKDLICKCGELMEFKGYPVWIQKIEKEGKDQDLAGLKVNLGERTKRISKRWFKKKTAQKEYIRKELAKV